MAIGGWWDCVPYYGTYNEQENVKGYTICPVLEGSWDANGSPVQEEPVHTNDAAKIAELEKKIIEHNNHLINNLINQVFNDTTAMLSTIRTGMNFTTIFVQWDAEQNYQRAMKVLEKNNG